MPKIHSKDKSQELDSIDWKAIEAISANGRISWADLAAELDLSPPAAAERVRRLEEFGVITGYTALVSPAAVGLGILAFLSVVMKHPKFREAFVEQIEAEPEVTECHHVTGDFDYLLKVRCRDTEALEDLISTRLKGLRGVVRSRTVISLATVKETTRLALGAVDLSPTKARKKS